MRRLVWCAGLDRTAFYMEKIENKMCCLLAIEAEARLDTGDYRDTMGGRHTCVVTNDAQGDMPMVTSVLLLLLLYHKSSSATVVDCGMGFFFCRRKQSATVVTTTVVVFLGRSRPSCLDSYKTLFFFCLFYSPTDG